ncbi:MAG: RNase adapter RapZ [Clostridia bacterium]|nr:RNase adapter RapZ [Clostridia bacterium]
MELIIVTGMSGAGKSHAIHCLEDLGYYCIDNMPPKLMDDFVTLVQNTSADFNKVAFVVDIRGGKFFGDLNESLEELKNRGVEYKIMFLEASNASLTRRYKETRRAHPLAPGGDIQEGIMAEREKLSELRNKATYIIDTSSIKVAELNSEIKRIFENEQKDTFTLMVESFGFKNGMPQEADWVLDARFLPNPFYVPSLKNFTGNNKKIKDYVLQYPIANKFAARVTGMVLDLIPSYIKEGKYHLTIAIGCTGGRHRSVVMANEIARRLEENGRQVKVKHRDL